MKPRDDTTRYLCAAAHLDPSFAERAIREYLLEPTRAIPPAPGVDAPVVLAESLAAWYRTKLRDWAVLGCLLVFVLLASWALIISWVVVGVVVGMASATPKDGTGTSSARAQMRNLTIGVAVVVVGGFALTNPLSEVAGMAERSPVLDVVAVLVALVAGGILVADEVTVWRLLTGRFGRGAGQVSMPSRETRPSLQYVAERYARQMNRVSERRPVADAGRNGDRDVPVVVSRGYDMFVGAGVSLEPWSVALPLERRPDVEVTALSAAKLYETIHSAFKDLRSQTDLSPSLRFGTLDVGETIVVAAEELVDRLGDREIAEFLADPSRPPVDRVPPATAHELRDRPKEWARYYLTVQLETWDRDFVVSAFLHFAVHEGTLYLEWTPCVLRPIQLRYRKSDSMSRSSAYPVQKAFVGLVGLPASVPGRVARVCARMRPLNREVLTPAMFGVRRSLREMAADTGLHNYFQLTDQERYVKVLESRLILALTRLLHESGYSTASFQQQLAAVVNNSVFIGAHSTVGAVSAGSAGSAQGLVVGGK